MDITQKMALIYETTTKNKAFIDGKAQKGFLTALCNRIETLKEQVQSKPADSFEITKNNTQDINALSMLGNLKKLLTETDEVSIII